MKLISLGQSCFTKIWIDEVFKDKQETNIFDWSITTPDIILDCLQTDFKNYSLIENSNPKYDHIKNIFDPTEAKETLCNIYGNYFIHYKNLSNQELKIMLKRRSERFLSLLNSNETIYLIYCNYSYIFADSNNNWKLLNEKQDEYYELLEQCSKIIADKNPNIKIISINTKNYKSENIYNITISNKHLSSWNKKSINNRKEIYKQYFHTIKEIISGMPNKKPAVDFARLPLRVLARRRRRRLFRGGRGLLFL